MIGRYLKIFLPIVTVLLLFVFSAFVVAKGVFATQNNGSITICKIIVDENGNIVDGSKVSGASFSIDGLAPVLNSGEGPGGILSKTAFSTPLTLNARVLPSSSGNDASCVTYDNLATGDYFYSQETISGSGNWNTPKYNDQFTTSVSSISDFYSYDNKLFDSDPTNDASRNTNADGHIVLETDRPHRTLLVLNQISSAPVTGGQSLSGASAPSCPVDGPQKVDQVWFSDIKKGQVTVHWANKGDAYGYHIAYGPTADNMLWGVEVAGNLNSYTLNSLPTGDLYVKIVAKKSVDCGGPTSDPFKVGGSTGQVLGASTLANTGVASNIILFAFGFGFLSLGLWQTQKALQKKSR